MPEVLLLRRLDRLKLRLKVSVLFTLTDVNLILLQTLITDGHGLLYAVGKFYPTYFSKPRINN